jgi:oxygen-independent coproporphyrinogen-3 oxidase
VDAHSMLLANREGHDFSRSVARKEKESGFSPWGPESVRFATAESLEQYVAGGPMQQTIVSQQTALEESFFLGLRLTRGVSLQDLSARFGEQAVDNFRSAIAELVENGLIEHTEDLIRLTSRGRMLSNDVFQRFILAHEVA